MPTEINIDNMVTLLSHKHVHMKNKEDVLQKIEKIRNDGPNKLQVITDYDKTITKQHINGQCVHNSWGLFNKSTQTSQAVKDSLTQLHQKYRPIELDAVISIDKKIAAMEEWMMKIRDLLMGIDFDPCEIDEIVRINGAYFRDGTQILFEGLNKAGVPILVFSAGQGDVVEAELKCHHVLFNNIKIISNFLRINNGKIDGFKNQKLIHVFNKNEHVIDDEYSGVLEGRNNIILMGDMTGDAGMADGIKNPGAILKIGFLYDNAEELLPSYLQAFDIVLVDDQTMAIPMAILKNLF